MEQAHYDDFVVGAGVTGLAHAYHLARRGRRVAVFERSPKAVGASVRNFGMLWPIGQPFGEQRALALRSLEIWLEVLRAAGLPHDCCGSLHLAYHEDEAQVLREYAALSENAGEPAELWIPPGSCERSRAVKREGLQAALWSARETCIDPRAVIAGLPLWLDRQHGVRVFTSAPRLPISTLPLSGPEASHGRHNASGFAAVMISSRCFPSSLPPVGWSGASSR